MSPWVGMIAVARPPVMPSGARSLSRAGASGGSAGTDMSHPAPDATRAGERMFVSLAGHSFSGAQGRNGVVIPDPRWTQLDVQEGGDRQELHLYTKLADAADEDGSRTYTWRLDGSYQYGALLCTAIDLRFGSSITPATATSAWGSTTLSVPHPGGAWSFAAVAAKRRNNTGSSNLGVVTTPGAVQIALRSGSSLPRGLFRHYAVPAGAGAIVAETDAPSSVFNGLFAVGIS